ncbi:STAS domain-containing protein [Actinoplanes sp. TFC3]|uniref:STAS domain-containing protein n=1 Tax=Actinoplanes sp. TFC3 TaxID=1710355 RepID=UPI00082B1231|nr:STAS domain-containing protein [Actinoplanes sp. TFC3]
MNRSEAAARGAAGRSAAVVRARAGCDLRRELHSAVDTHSHVVVDLAEVPTLDDAMLGQLVRAHRNARRRGGMVCLAAPSRVVITVLHTMHVDGLFPMFDDCGAALEFLAEPGERSVDGGEGRPRSGVQLGVAGR